jgi:ribosomal protein S1
MDTLVVMVMDCQAGRRRLDLTLRTLSRHKKAVHISQLANRYISDPNAVVQVNQQVTVTVLEVDIPRKRIALSMKAVPTQTT